MTRRKTLWHSHVKNMLNRNINKTAAKPDSHLQNDEACQYQNQNILQTIKSCIQEEWKSISGRLSAMACGFSESKHRKVLLTLKEKNPALGTTDAENLLLLNYQHEAVRSKDLTKKHYKDDKGNYYTITQLSGWGPASKLGALPLHWAGQILEKIQGMAYKWSATS